MNLRKCAEKIAPTDLVNVSEYSTLGSIGSPFASRFFSMLKNVKNDVRARKIYKNVVENNMTISKKSMCR